MQATREFLDPEEQERQREKFEDELKRETVQTTFADQQAKFQEMLRKKAERADRTLERSTAKR